MTIELGYTLSSEEHGPTDLVRHAGRAEQAGFGFATISDHFHPWTDAQGESPFVWCTLGGIAATTSTLRVGTAVTCPLIRMHPAVVAQAAATAALMFDGRFFLGVGTGERLNEHVLGNRWPGPVERREMLEEAVTVIRDLWRGAGHSHRGRHYTVEQARLYSVPQSPPPVFVAAGGPASSRLAGRIGDGLIATAPQASTVGEFRGAGGQGKPCVGQLHVCWAPSRQTGIVVAHTVWPNAALPGQLTQELALPSHFQQAVTPLSAADVAAAVICGPDPDLHLAGIRAFHEAGFNQLSVHQVGPDQEGFLRFYADEILPVTGTW